MDIPTKNLDIAPDQVYDAAAVGRAHHERLAGTYASTQSQGWDAQAGWVGQSGMALTGLLDRWQSDAADHHRLLNDYHDGLHNAATAFIEVDGAGAQKLDSVDVPESC